MLKTMAILFVAFVIVLIEYPMLKKGEFKRERFVFIFFLLIGITLNLIINFNLNIPSLIDWLSIVYQPISQLISNWLS